MGVFQHNIALLNHVFDKVLVLTIPRAESRRANIIQSFEGLNFEFFYGVDKNTLSVESLLASGEVTYYYEQSFSRSPKEFHEGNVACSWSHRNMYHYIQENGWRRTLLLEDDAIPAQWLYEFPADALFGDWLFPYNVWALGHLKSKPCTTASMIKQQLYTLWHYLNVGRWQKRSLHYIRHMYTKPVNEHWLEAGEYFGTHAYAIDQYAARTFSQLQSPIGFTADYLVNYALLQEGSLKGVLATRPLIRQANELFQSV